MKVCVRCHHPMTECFNFYVCYTDGCNVTGYHEKDEDTYYWTFNFQDDHPFIFVKTGKANGQPLTSIDYEEEREVPGQPMASITIEKHIAKFDKEMLDITSEKLKTIIVFS